MMQEKPFNNLVREVSKGSYNGGDKMINNKTESQQHFCGSYKNPQQHSTIQTIKKCEQQHSS